jgi:hypothetical protein
MPQRYPIGHLRSPASDRPRRRSERCDKLPLVVLAASPALTFTVGLLVTFLGIGVIANVLIGYAVVQVLGERQQNEQHRSGVSES